VAKFYKQIMNIQEHIDGIKAIAYDSDRNSQPENRKR
jgi:hypothetical protein